MQNVLDDGACRAGDDADPLGEFRERFFPGRVEPAAGAKLFFELMELEEEFADPEELELADHDLVLAAGGVETDLSLGDHLVPLFRHAGEGGGASPEEDSRDLGAGVLQAEVEMARGLELEIADLAPDRKGAEVGFQEGFDRGAQL